MKKDNTLLELVTGIILVGVAVQIVCLIAFPNDLYNAIGLWSGVAIGSGMAIHMKHSIEDALDLLWSASYEALHRRCIGSWRDRRGKTCQNDVCTEDNGSFDFDGMRTLF